MDDQDITGTYTMPVYEGFVWTTMSKTGIDLTAGQHIMKISFDTNGIGGLEVANINYVSLSAAEISGHIFLGIQSEGATFR